MVDRPHQKLARRVALGIAAATAFVAVGSQSVWAQPQAPVPPAALTSGGVHNNYESIDNLFIKMPSIGTATATAVTRKLQAFADAHKSELGDISLADPKVDPRGAVMQNWNNLGSKVIQAYDGGVPSAQGIAYDFAQLCNGVKTTINTAYVPPRTLTQRP